MHVQNTGSDQRALKKEALLKIFREVWQVISKGEFRFPKTRIILCFLLPFLKISFVTLFF